MEKIEKQKRLLNLMLLHMEVVSAHNILVSVYRSASGFLWSMSKADSGTDLGYSDYAGNCPHSGAYLEYEDALEDALALVQNYPLSKFKEEFYEGIFHWGNYAGTAIKKCKTGKDILKADLTGLPKIRLGFDR